MQPLTAPDLAVPHGFFPRTGGVSTGLYASLNCGYGSGDAQEAVRENRRRVAAWFGAQERDMLTCYQVHGAHAVTVSAPWADTPPQADAMVTATRGLVLGILTADCAPVLLADAEASVIGAAHAGWKGAHAGILQHTVARMLELGARPERIHAAIGPCIAQASYEVGPEFMERLVQAAPENARFFAPGAAEGKALFNLNGYVTGILQAIGITSITSTGIDTLADEARCFSYRRATLRAEPVYGRQISCITLP